MNASSLPSLLVFLLSASFFLPACKEGSAQAQEEHHEAAHKIVVTSPVEQDVDSMQQYVSQIHSRRHIEVRALQGGYLQEINVQEGQLVEKGVVMFKVVPILYQARLDTEQAEAKLAQINYDNTKILFDKNVVSSQELALKGAELAKAQARVKLARAELNFSAVKAPFDGIIDRQFEQQGSLVEEGDILTTMSDNSVMWVYFNVPEARYFQYKKGLDEGEDELRIELQLANGEIFPHPGKIGAIEADFNNETGNIAFRADFPNPKNLLRHGQTGTILVHRTLHDAIVIPQRATYEILAKKYVYVVEPADEAPPASKEADHAGHAESAKKEDHAPAAEHEGAQGSKHESGDEAALGTHFGIVHQREVIIQEELDDVYVIKKGLSVDDRIIFEGVLQVRDGDRIRYEWRPPEKILSNLKHHAE